MTVASRIEAKLNEALAPAHVTVTDDWRGMQAMPAPGPAAKLISPCRSCQSVLPASRAWRVIGWSMNC